MTADDPIRSAAPPPRLAASSPLGWLAVFGPGAIIASVTIGTGELIFSSRGGALFGYRILFVFVFISLLKWGLVLGTARHMVLTGVHPFERMAALPGPRGWLVLVIFLILSVCLPVWVSFHSGVLGNLASWVTGTQNALGGCADYFWAGAALAAVLLLTLTGGYSRLERVQILIVGGLILCAGITLILYSPDWVALFTGAVVPRKLAYPPWLEGAYPQIAAQPVWVETTRYVGVIAGSAFDYLAYTSWLRDKRWGRAGGPPATASELEEIAANPDHEVRQWLRAPFVDCSISFVLIVAFSAVFVAAGTMFLGPAQKIPDAANLLNLQSEFVTRLHPWLLPLYIVGAFLTMLGTLYGTFEIASATFRELARVARPRLAVENELRLKRICTLWCAGGGYLFLAWMLLHQWRGGADKPRLLIDIVTPANLFTGVFGCGLVCLLLPWMDRRLPPALRMPWWLLWLNVASGFIFLVLGLKGYWDDKSRAVAIGSMLALLAISVFATWVIERRMRARTEPR